MANLLSPAGEPSGEAQQQVVLYSPPGWDIVMSDAPALPTAPSAGLQLPPWIAELNAGLRTSYDTILTLARQVDANNRQSVDSLYRRYEEMTETYRIATSMARANTKPSQEQI